VVVVFHVPTVLHCSTDLLYMCSKQKHKKGLAPRAQEGHSSTGISRLRTEVLRTRTYCSAANTLLRNRALHGHLNLSNGIWWFVVRGRRFLCTYSTVLWYRFALRAVKKTHKADHGHKKGHAPRAQDGHSSTGISRPRTEVLRTRAYFSAANTMLRSRASRGHLKLYVVKYQERSVVQNAASEPD